MTAQLLTVLSRAVPGHLDEFRRWYDDVHIVELRERYPEIQYVERHDLTKAHGAGQPAEPHGMDSIAIYIVEGNPGQLWQRMRRDRTLSRSTTFDYAAVQALYDTEELLPPGEQTAAPDCLPSQRS